MVASVREQEPFGKGHELLTEWALWCRGGSPTRSNEWSVKERLDPPHDQDPPDSVILTDRIVAGVGVQYPDYRRIVKRYYLNAESYWQVAGELRLTVGFVRLSVQAVCDLVARRHENLTMVA